MLRNESTMNEQKTVALAELEVKAHEGAELNEDQQVCAHAFVCAHERVRAGGGACVPVPCVHERACVRACVWYVCHGVCVRVMCA